VPPPPRAMHGSLELEPQPLDDAPADPQAQYHVGHFGPQHRLSPEQAWQAEHLLRRANHSGRCMASIGSSKRPGASPAMWGWCVTWCCGRRRRRSPPCPCPAPPPCIIVPVLGQMVRVSCGDRWSPKPGSFRGVMNRKPFPLSGFVRGGTRVLCSPANRRLSPALKEPAHGPKSPHADERHGRRRHGSAPRPRPSFPRFSMPSSGPCSRR